MKYWEVVATLIAVERGEPESTFRDHEAEARKALRLALATRHEIEKEAPPWILEHGINLLKTDRYQMLREIANAEHARAGRN